MQRKRADFARFYFLGDDDLLDVIGQAANKPWVIQNHLKKLFAGVHCVQFSADNRQIVAIESIEGEFLICMPLGCDVEKSVENEVENG